MATVLGLGVAGSDPLVWLTAIASGSPHCFPRAFLPFCPWASQLRTVSLRIPNNHYKHACLHYLRYCCLYGHCWRQRRLQLVLVRDLLDGR